MTSYWSVLNSNLGPILPCFRDRAESWKPLFDTPSLFRSKFQGVPLGEGPGCWGLQRSKTFEEFQPMHRQVFCCSNTTFCVASRSKNSMALWSVRQTDSDTNKKAVLSQRWPRDARYISRSWAVVEIWPFEIIQDGGGRHLEFVRIENSAIRSAAPKTPPYNQTWSGSDDRLRRYGHLKFFQHGGGRHLGFVPTVNSAVRSAAPGSDNVRGWSNCWALDNASGGQHYCSKYRS